MGKDPSSLYYEKDRDKITDAPDRAITCHGQKWYEEHIPAVW